MPVTNYISVNGRMLSEVTDGVILDYVPDALGSIHSVVDQTATAVKTMRYKPYGEVLSRSGSISDRMYQWVGTYGYRATFNYASSHYVRARHYSQTPGSWTTVDALWPDESAYGYVGGVAVRERDPSGLAPQSGFQGCRLDIPSGINICGHYIDFNLPPCVDISNSYANDFLATGNKLARCASCVSSYICLAIMGGSLGPGPVSRELARQLQCQNSCMFDLYRKKTTPLWKKAKKICDKYRESSKECCLASVDAEQDGFTRCALKCFPVGSLIPYDLRLKFAKDMFKCCD